MSAVRSFIATILTALSLKPGLESRVADLEQWQLAHGDAMSDSARQAEALEARVDADVQRAIDTSNKNLNTTLGVIRDSTKEVKEHFNSVVRPLMAEIETLKARVSRLENEVSPS